MQLQQVEGAGQGRSDREALALPGHLIGSGFFSATIYSVLGDGLESRTGII